LRDNQNEVDIVGFAPVHRFWPAVMAVPANGDPGPRPVAADAPDQPAKVATDHPSGWRLARPQQHRHAVATVRVVDMDRQEASFVVVRIEQQ
jgi:hypothetical protein